MLFPTHSAQQAPLVVPWAASATHLGYGPRAQECCVVGMAWPPSGLPRRPGEPFSGLSQELLTQLKRQALGAVKFRESNPVRTLLPTAVGLW